MMLRADSMNHLSFDLSVIGTANKPTSVRCVLGSNPTASFEAHSSGTSTWFCDVDLPLFIEANEVPFKVEVLINGRLFTPLSTSLKVDRAPRFETKIEEPEVVLPDVPVQVTPEPVKVPEAVVEKQEPKPVEAPEPEVVPVQPVVEEKKVPSEDDKKKVAAALSKIFEAPIKNPTTTSIKGTSSVFAQVDEMTGIKAKPVKPVEPKPKPRRVSIPESRPHKVVVHVTKGPVIYK